MNLIDKVRAQRHIRQSRYRPQFEDIPAGLFPFWQRNSGREFAGIPTDRLFFIRAATGLMRFFEVAADRRQPCALPSLAADSVWHAWTAWDPVNLEHFCRWHFGRPIRHLPNAELDALALPRALVGCRVLEGVPPQGPALPALFGLDFALRMPSGYHYAVEGVNVFYTPMNPDGQSPGRGFQHGDLTLDALLGANLISAAQHADALRSRAQGDRQGGSMNGGGSGGDGDGIDCDSDGSGGGGCGGGCGGD